MFFYLFKFYLLFKLDIVDNGIVNKMIAMFVTAKFTNKRLGILSLSIVIDLL